MVTLPMIGHASADKNGGGDVNKMHNQLPVRFKQRLPRKGTPFKLTPDTTDGVVYQDEYVNFLDKT